MLNKDGASRHLAWDACYNVRELGGYPIEDGGETQWGAFVRADNLCRLTPEGEKALVDYRVRTIIDLRTAPELALGPNPFAGKNGYADPPTYVNLSLVDPEDNEGIRAIDYAPSTEAGYVIILERYRKQTASIIQAIGDAREGVVLFHCHGGKDRTGLVAAILLALAGVPHEIIAEDYAITDTYLQPFYDEELSDVGKDQAELERLARMFASPPAAMLAVLSYLDTEHGGVGAYLRGAGVTQQAIERIRNRLRP